MSSHTWLSMPDGSAGRTDGLVLTETDVFIAVMGVTGAGKSTLISLLTDEKGTHEIEVYKCKYQDNLYLVDTPGFDDSEKTDVEILHEIASWLGESFTHNILLSGIIYLHRITDPRMQGSAKDNLFMFKKLCGKDALIRVILATTRWEGVKPGLGEKRETDLATTEDFWGYMISQGSRIERHYNNVESAAKLINLLVDGKKIVLEIQEEMVTDRKPLDKTNVGRELWRKLEEKQSKYKRRLQVVDEQMDQALTDDDWQAAEQLQVQQHKMNNELARIKNEGDSLRVDMERMNTERLARLEARLEEQRAETLRAQRETFAVREDALKAQKEALKAQKEARDARKALEDARKALKELDLSKAETGSRKTKCQCSNTCVTFNGTSWCFGGPENWAWKVTAYSLLDYLMARTLQRKDVFSRYIKLSGRGRHYYYHCRENGVCKSSWSHDVESQYLGTLEHLESSPDACPHSVALGGSGHYFINLVQSQQIYYNLPEDLTDHVGEMDCVDRVWLGDAGAYVVALTSGQLFWDLKEQYPGLDKSLEATEGDDILDIALAPDDPTSYIIITKSSWGARRIAGALGFLTGAGCFNWDKLNEFVKENFPDHKL